MVRKYCTFSPDFKLDTVMEGFRGEKSIVQICREREIKDVLYYKWRDTFIENAASVFGGQGDQPAKARFLVEFDNSTHPLYRFGKHKALPGLNYIRSEVYKNRFGFNSGRWLVICKSETRLKHLKSQTEYVLGNQASNFLFSIISELNYQTVLTSPVWHLGASNNRESLVKNVGSILE